MEHSREGKKEWKEKGSHLEMKKKPNKRKKGQKETAKERKTEERRTNLKKEKNKRKTAVKEGRKVKTGGLIKWRATFRR